MNIQAVTTVTQKGQITIPKSLRHKFGIKPFSKVYLKDTKRTIEIIPSFDILDLAGKFKPVKAKRKSVTLAREEMEKNFNRF